MNGFYLCIVAFLIVLAVFDLIVGVSNDAVNFLNSAIGAKVARFRTIVAVAAVGQGRHKHIGRDDLAGVRVNDGSGIAGPVHLHDLTGLVIYVHGGIGFRQVVTVILVERS